MKISKDEYILRNFSKIQHKKWELYVIARIIHLLNDPELRNYYSRHNMPDNMDYDGHGNYGRFPVDPYEKKSKKKIAKEPKKLVTIKSKNQENLRLAKNQDQKPVSILNTYTP